MKWLGLSLISAIILTGCGGAVESSDGSEWVEIGRDAAWKCVGPDKVFDGYESIAVVPNSPDCTGPEFP
jgi:hypothetical protein